VTEPVGLAYARSPLQDALATLRAGATFTAVVQAASGGEYRLSTPAGELRLQSDVALSTGRRVAFTVRQTDPLVLEIRTEVPAPAAAGPPADVEAAIRKFAAARPEAEGAARWLAARGLGFDARVAAGLSSLVLRPDGAAALVERAVAANEDVRAAVEKLAARPGDPATGRFQGAAGADIARELFAAAERILEAMPVPPDAESLRNHPRAAELRELLTAGRELAERSAASRLLSADAASRGEAQRFNDAVWLAQGRYESAFARVERRVRGPAGAPDESSIAVTLRMSKLGLLRAVLRPGAASLSVSVVAATRLGKRVLDRRRKELVEALARLGTRADVAVTEGPVDPPFALSSPSVDVRA
jgi:hypothetical protein